jgi:hypothetical protein
MKITEDDPAPEYYGVIDFRAVFGSDPQTGLLDAVLRPLPMVPTLRILATLGSLMRYNSISDKSIQLALAREFGVTEPAQRDQLISLLNTTRGIWIHEEQLSVLSRFALVYCEGRALPLDHNRCLFRALLAFNFQRNAETTTTATGTEAFLATELQSLGTDDESTFLLLRRYALFLDWGRTREARAFVNDWLDLEGDFLQDTGLSIDELRTVVLLLEHRYDGPHTIEEIATYEPEIDLEDAFSALPSRSVIMHAITILSMTPDEARLALGERPLVTSLFSMLPFSMKPLLQVAQGRYVVPVRRHLLGQIGTGLFYRLAAIYSRRDKERKTASIDGEPKGKSDFLRYHRLYGHFLESHVRNALRSATRALATHIDGDQPYRVRKREFRGSDVYLTFGNSLVIVEVTSSRLGVERALFDRNSAALDVNLSAMVVSKFKQIKERYDDWRRGSFEIEGVERSAIKRVLAVVVTAHALPRMIAVNERLRTAIAPFVGEFEGYEILEAEDIEMLERQFPDGDLNLAELLRRKLATRPGAFRGLKNYLFFFEPEMLNVKVHGDVQTDPAFARPIALARTWDNGKNAT